MRKQANVLIVDDAPEVVTTFRTLLEMEGHVCTVAYDADEALVLCQQARFDCLLLDYQLGAKSGLDVANALIANASWRPSSVVIVSAQPRDRFHGALDSGLVDGFHQKPVDCEKLLSSVAESLSATESPKVL